MTRVMVPSLWSLRRPMSASLRTWWEQVDWLMLSSWGELADGDAAGRGGDAVQEPHPGRCGEAGEPFGVGRGLLFGQGRGGACGPEGRIRRRSGGNPDGRASD